MIDTGGDQRTDTDLFTVQSRAVDASETGRAHLDQVRDVVFRAGGRTGVAHHLHGQSAHEQAVHHGFKGFFIPTERIQAGIPDLLNALMHDVVDDRADCFAGELMRNLPVGERDELAEHVSDAAGREISRSPGDDVEIGDDNKRRHRVHGVFIAVPGHGGNRRAVPIHAGRGRERYKGNPSLSGTVTDSIMDRTASAGQEDFRILRQLPQDFGGRVLIRMKPFGRENNLLLCPGMGEKGIVPCIAAVYGAAFSMDVFFVQNLIQMMQNTGVDDARPGGHPMLFSTDTASAVLPAVYPHNKLPLLVKVHKIF